MESSEFIDFEWAWASERVPTISSLLSNSAKSNDQKGETIDKEKERERGGEERHERRGSVYARLLT